MKENEVILKVEKAYRYFGNLAAVNGLSFEVYKNEIFGIAGPNGSGKTTLMNIITQVIPPNGGEIFFNDQAIHDLKAHQICHLGIARTFQNPTVFESMSILDNMIIGSTFGRNLNKTQYDLEKIKEIAEFVGLMKPLSTLASSLLVNDKKKLMIAIALMTEPVLLLLDEPCAGLNVSEAKESIELIRRIGEKGITIILIEHNMQVLMNISERVLIMENGSQLCIGPPSFVCSDHKVIETYLGKKTAKGVEDIVRA